MEEEIFGPVLTIYVYPADKFEETVIIILYHFNII